MPLRKPSSRRRKARRPAGRKGKRGLLKAPLKVAFELGAILLEIVRIPLRVWLRVAEVAGRVVLAVWRAALPVLAASGRILGRAVAASAKAVTPARTAIVVALFAAGALAASQFVDYRAIAIGAPDYRGVVGVAPPPQVDAATPQSPHGIWLLAIAAVAIALICFAAITGRWRGTRLLVPLGAAAVVIAIAVDAPQGLDTGQVGIAYQGARAQLLSGFGAEVAAGGVLAFAGVLMTLYAPATARRRSRTRLRVPRRRARRRRRDPERRAPRTTPRKASG
jgi:hypothetical protein